MTRVALVVALCCAVAARSADPPTPTGRDAPARETVLFTAGTDGYASYRIPVVVAGAKGTLLAFGTEDGDAGMLEF